MEKKGMVSENYDKKPVCPNCGGNNVSFTVALEEEKRGTGEGCFLSYIAMVLLLFIPVLGWILLFAMFHEKRKSVSVTYALCNNCGYNWRLQQQAEINKKKTNRKTFIFILLVILLIFAVVEFYLMAKYKGWI